MWQFNSKNGPVKAKLAYLLAYIPVTLSAISNNTVDLRIVLVK